MQGHVEMTSYTDMQQIQSLLCFMVKVRPGSRLWICEMFLLHKSSCQKNAVEQKRQYLGRSGTEVRRSKVNLHLSSRWIQVPRLSLLVTRRCNCVVGNVRGVNVRVPCSGCKLKKLLWTELPGKMAHCLFNHQIIIENVTLVKTGHRLKSSWCCFHWAHKGTVRTFHMQRGGF